MKRAFFLMLALLTACALSPAALAEPADGPNDGDAVYTMVDMSGTSVMSIAGRIYADDEYISSDNRLYVVVEVDDEARQAVAMCMGEEPAYDADEAREVFAHAGEATGESDAQRLICIYSTHSDESYEKGDGASSLEEGAGIFDVNQALKQALEELGVTVRLDTTTHLPHDAKAYSRSRRTAKELMELRPDALLDIHRDGIPDESEYETEVDGEKASKVRLLVGRSNPNADANREFAKEIKAVADEKYDGLIKDIFIGKGNYNQELYPQALLLEFGTHTLDKDLAMKSTGYMADVLNTVLYGGTASADAAERESDAAQNGAAVSGVIWAVVIVAIGGLIYALISTGTLRNLGAKISNGAGELTGGLFGRKKPKK